MADVIQRYTVFLLFIVGIYFYKKTKPALANRIIFPLLTVLSGLYFYAYLLIDFLTRNGIDQSVAYHIKFGLEGTGWFDFKKEILFTIAFIFFSCVLFIWLFRRWEVQFPSPRYWLYAYMPLVLTIFLNPANFDIYELIMNNSTESEISLFDAYYERPELKTATTSKNLVIIYAEGLELSYFDEKVFPGLVKELKHLRSESINFNNIDTVIGAGWTIGGIVASQCGLPLFTPSTEGNNISQNDNFLPAAVCLSDLLHEQNYHQTYIGGASLDFSGKRIFLNTHNYDEIYGRSELSEKIDRHTFSAWGVNDDRLLDFAFEKYMENWKQFDRNLLVILTLDTHHPSGHVSEQCGNLVYQDGKNSMLNAVACSDRLIAQFVDKIRQSPYGGNTVIAIMSDHLAMRNSATVLLDKLDRKNLFMVIEPGRSSELAVSQKGSALDVGTTLMPFIGYNPSLGLGRDLNDHDSAGDIETIQKYLPKWQKAVSRFWGFPTINNSVSFDLENNRVSLDGRTYEMPIFISMDENLATNIKYGKNKNNNLYNAAASLGANSPYIFIDKFGQPDYYLMIGNGNDCKRKIKIEKGLAYSAAEISDMACIPQKSGKFDVKRVAHAGGAWEGNTYTNSIEALDENLKNGFTYFEIDFSFTQDGQLACVHDWTKWLNEKTNSGTSRPLTMEEFKLLIEKTDFKICSLETLAAWMAAHPSAVIVTDVKDDNLSALKIISEKIPDFARRVIPQIYTPSEYEKARAMGYDMIIWTLYRYGGNNDKVLAEIKNFHGPVAITMPVERAAAGLPRKLKENGIPTYVHTINSKWDEFKYLTIYGADEIYTDFLTPL